MATIKHAAPIEFNIKTKTEIIFAGDKVYPPFEKNIVFDMQENPHRWDIEYVVEKVEETVVEKKEETVPELEKSVAKKSEAATKMTAQVKAKRKKITSR